MFDIAFSKSFYSITNAEGKGKFTGKPWFYNQITPSIIKAYALGSSYPHVLTRYSAASLRQV